MQANSADEATIEVCHYSGARGDINKEGRGIALKLTLKFHHPLRGQEGPVELSDVFGWEFKLTVLEVRLLELS